MKPVRKPLTEEQREAKNARERARYAAASPRILTDEQKSARRARDRTRSPEAKEKEAAYVKAWREANPEKVAEHRKHWYAENPEKRAASRRKWKIANPDKDAKHSAKYRKANPEVFAAHAAHRRAMKLQATPQWADEFLISEIYELSRLRTKVTGLEWHVDHIVPLKGGTVCGLHCEDNLRVIPGLENRRKRNRHWPDMPGVV